MLSSSDATVAIPTGKRRRKPCGPWLRYSRAGILQPDDVDGRSRHARRYRRLSDELAAEVGRPLTAVERTVVGQAVRLLLRSETETDVDKAIRLSSESRRLLQSLMPKGGKNKPDNVMPPMRERLALEGAAE